MNGLRLPDSAQEIADVIGRERTLYLIGQLPVCGQRSWRVVLYVPKTLPADHWLVRVLGWRDAMRLVREFGGEILQPSNCRCVHRAYRDQSIHRMAGEGMSAADIARAVGLTRRRVSGVLAADAAPRAVEIAGPSQGGTARG
ncbi:MAG: hypothetical protein PF501_19030 [Salinisphaera sp.]|jgi:hypothetical protein|nr:hypothetical protein [Salinisphaera sp.]